MNKHHLMLAAGAGLLIGFFLANAPSGTGIYSTPLGSALASVYLFGQSKSGAAA